MRNQARCLRLPWVALAAMVGMLWGGADVSACTSRDAPKARSCCARQMTADCGCCKTADDVPAGPLSSPSRVPGTSFTGIRPSPCGTCVCSPSSPASQGERRETRTSEERLPRGFLRLSPHRQFGRPFARIQPGNTAQAPALSYPPLFARRAPDHLNRSHLRDRPIPASHGVGATGPFIGRPPRG